MDLEDLVDLDPKGNLDSQAETVFLEVQDLKETEGTLVSEDLLDKALSF